MGLRVKRIDSLKRLISLIPESSLDLLNLFRLVRTGDQVFSETSREIKKERASGKIDSERIRLILGIEVEEKLIDPMMKRIGFSGKIIYESKPLDLTGKHHTIHIHPGAELEIRSRKDFERLRAFAESYLREKPAERVLCISIDDEGAAIAEFTSHELRSLYSKRIPSVDKSISWSEKEFKSLFKEVLEVVKDRLSEDEDLKLLIIGQGIFVEDFLTFLRREDKALTKRIRGVYKSSIGGEEGIRELMRSDVLKELASSLKPFKDSIEVEKFIRSMSSNPEKVALGLEQVLKAWRLGAVEKILVSEGYLWEHIVDESLDRILSLAESGKLKLQVLLDGLEASEKILRLGGIVAFLRYPYPSIG